MHYRFEKGNIAVICRDGQYRSRTVLAPDGTPCLHELTGEAKLLARIMPGRVLLSRILPDAEHECEVDVIKSVRIERHIRRQMIEIFWIVDFQSAGPVTELAIRP